MKFAQRDDDANIRGNEGSARVENDSPPPELNDKGGTEGTPIGIAVTYAQRDDNASIRSNDGSTRVESNSVHDTVSAYVDSSELCATPNPSRLYSRRHDSINCITLDDRIPLRIDTAGDTLLEDEIFYRDDIPGSIDSNYSSRPTFTPDGRTLRILAKAILCWNHLRKRMNVCSTRERALDWQSRFAVLLCGGTVRMTVEYYETLRETLIWQALKHGKREDALPGIRNIQRAIVILMRCLFYTRSEVVALRKRNSGTDKVLVVVPSEWATVVTCTAPLIDTLFSIPSSTSTASGPSFMI